MKTINALLATLILAGIGATAFADDIPEVVSATVVVNKMESGDHKVHLTIRAKSVSAVKYLNLSLDGPKGNIFGGGGGGIDWKKVGDDLWEDVEEVKISKYAPSGTYVFSGLSVENAARQESATHQELSFEINNPDYHGDVPTIISAEPEVTNDRDGNVVITLTIRAMSKSPVNFLNISLNSPRANVYGGGSGGVRWTQVGENLWQEVTHTTISRWALGGNYTFSNISVENEAQEESAEFRPVIVKIETEFTPKILSVVPHSIKRVNGDTEITLTVRAFSRTPVRFLSLSLDDPNGKSVYGGGSSADFAEVGENTWEFTTYRTVIDRAAPRGTYVFSGITVENTLQEESREFDPIRVDVE